MEFHVAIICAFATEYNAACLIFDEIWDDKKGLYVKNARDANYYTTGRIGKHNVVLLLLPSKGKVAAASATASMRLTFPSLSLALVVGVCGGAPTSQRRTIQFGDVVISKSIVQYDFGRQYPEGFKRKDTIEANLGRPNKEIRSLLGILETTHGQRRLETRSAEFLQSLRDTQRNEPPYQQSESALHHKHPDTAGRMCAKQESTCEQALDIIITQPAAAAAADGPLGNSPQKGPLPPSSTGAYRPTIHFGIIASGDTVIMSAAHRDRIIREDSVIAFEMEGAGVWDEMPCLVIKGVSDFADSGKHKHWQELASLGAACCAKALLERYVSPSPIIAAHAAPQAGPPLPVAHQDGGRFTSDVDAVSVNQGNRLKTTSKQPREYVQGGSEFSGNIRAESLVQGNEMTFD